MCLFSAGFSRWPTYCHLPQRNAADSLKQLSQIGGRRLGEGFWILIFPKGHAHAAGPPFSFPRRCRLACANNAPVIPVAHNAGEFWPKVG